MDNKEQGKSENRKTWKGKIYKSTLQSVIYDIPNTKNGKSILYHMVFHSFEKPLNCIIVCDFVIFVSPL